MFLKGFRVPVIRYFNDSIIKPFIMNSKKYASVRIDQKSNLIKSKLFSILKMRNINIYIIIVFAFSFVSDKERSIILDFPSTKFKIKKTISGRGIVS